MKLPSRARLRPINTMLNTASFSTAARRTSLFIAALLTVLAPCLPMNAQNPGQRVSQLPPTPPTTLQQQAAPAGVQTSPEVCQQPPCAATTIPGAPQPTKPHHATITFADGQLTVTANDSSLHQILRSISSSTGMTITGGVEEQRVFGTYGPSAPSTILATLLDGTGVNMLLKDGPNHVPLQLVLTQRSGGPTASPITAQDEQIGTEQPPVVSSPPPASAPVVAATPSAAAQPQPVAQPVTQPTQQVVTTPTPPTSGPPSMPQPANNVLGNPNNSTPTASQIPTATSAPIDSLPTPSTTVQTQQGIVDTPNQPQQGPQAPTADSIFQQLLQMQKAKAAAAANPGSSSTPPPSTTPPPQ